jgi:hypothetical protein
MIQSTLHSVVSQLSTPIIRSILSTVYPIVYPLPLEMERTEKMANLDLLGQEEAREELLHVLGSREKVAVLYKSLSNYEHHVLESFIFHVGQDFLTYRQIEHGIEGIKPTLFRIGITGLRRKGLIYTVRRQWGEVAYFLPSELEYNLYSCLIEEDGFDEIESCQEDVSPIHDERPPFYTDIFTLLDDFRSKKGEIPLTKKGSIHKIYIRSWQEKWPTRDQELEACSLIFEHRETYTAHVVLLLDFLTKRSLIRWYEGKAVLDNTETTLWMGLSRNRMREEFIQYWLSVVTPSTPWLERYIKDMTLSKEGEWYYLLSSVEVWEDRYELPAIEQVIQLVKTELLEPLVALGCIDIGKTENGEDVWRWKTYEESAADFWIQPTLELYCPGIIHFSTLWRLTNVFSFEEWENMLILTPSKQKLKRLVERGESLQEWFEWLSSISYVPIPQGLEDQLQQWQKSQQQVFISEMTVIEVGDKQVANAFEQWSETSLYTVRRITPTLFLVPTEDKQEITNIFTKRGLQVQTKHTLSAEYDKARSIIPLIVSRREALNNAKVESVYPDITEAIPGWERLPDIWKKQFSAYHDNTKHQIVDQAIQHHLILRVEDASGRILEFTPVSCQVEQGNWVCYDQQRKKFQLKQLNRMQLLFPDVHG